MDSFFILWHLDIKLRNLDRRGSIKFWWWYTARYESFFCMDISLDIICTFINSVANVSNNLGVNLLVTEITMTGLLVLKGSRGYRIYKKWFLNNALSQYHIYSSVFVNFMLWKEEANIKQMLLTSSDPLVWFIPNHYSLSHHYGIAFKDKVWKKIIRPRSKNNNFDCNDGNERPLELNNQVTHSVQ